MTVTTEQISAARQAYELLEIVAGSPDAMLAAAAHRARAALDVALSGLALSERSER
jgi:hypothetical protein